MEGEEGRGGAECGPRASLAVRRSAQLPKLKDLSRKRPDSIEVLIDTLVLSRVKFKEDQGTEGDLEFEYGDCDPSFAAELSELYAYSELPDFLLNANAFESYRTEVLVEVAERVMAELKTGVENGLRVGETAVAWAKEKSELAWATAVGVPMVVTAAMVDLSSVPEEKVAGREALEKMSWDVLVAFCMWLGNMTGRWLGGLLLGWWMTGPVGVLGLFIGVPIAGLSWLFVGQPSEKERPLGFAFIGAVVGLLHGFNLRNYVTARPFPGFLLPLQTLVILRCLGGQLCNQADRSYLLGALVAQRLVIFLGLAAVFDVITLATLFFLLASTAFYVLTQQLGFHRILHTSDDVWLDAALPFFSLLGPLALDSLFTYLLSDSD